MWFLSTVENLDWFCFHLRVAVMQHRNIIPLRGAGGASGVGMWDPIPLVFPQGRAGLSFIPQTR